MTAERGAALEQFFEHPRGLARSPKDAVALAVEGCLSLEEHLEVAGELGEDADQGARAEAEDRIYEAAVALGKVCIDGLQGLVVSGAVNTVAPRLAAMPEEAPPLDDAWRKVHNPSMALVAISSDQRDRLAGLTEQPNQLFRHLHDLIALAADVATWTAWTQWARQSPSST